MSPRRLALSLGACAALAIGVAAAQPTRLPSPIQPPPGRTVRPVRPPPVVTPPRLPVPGGVQTRSFERESADGGVRFKVTLEAAKAVDARALDYVEATLRIVPTARAGRDLDDWKKHAGPGKPGHDITVTITTLDGKPVTDHMAMPADGVEVLRPGTLRVKDDMVEALARARTFRFPGRVPVIPRPAPPPPPPPGPPPPVDGLHGTLKCRATNDTSGATTDRPLPWVAIKVGDQTTTANPDGTFRVPGTYGPGSYTLQLTYDAQVGSATLRSPLRVMAEFHDARGQSVARPGTLAGDRISVGDVVVTGVDCEIWRLGAEALEDYHTTVGRQPPDRELRLKRWSGVWDGTPYAYYDYIVLTTSFGAAGNYRDLGVRRRTIFHEFGHTIRHVADGDELHWGWDNFRWAYARNHSGCETFNVQYAFNEGWAGYWAAERAGGTFQNCGKAAAFLDWTEDMITGHLVELANALSTNPRLRAQKMVQVLEENPGKIHSIREFEVAYCRLHSAGNARCRNATTPARAAPASCPPGFIDDGATCRLDNIQAKPSYGRGVGTVPTVCGGGRELDAGLCYPRCDAGYSGVGPVCWQGCPSGYRDDGAFCAKPAPYGRGAGYPWEFGDPAFNLDRARDRCRAANPGGCEQHGLIWYPKCRAGFHAAGCCICSPNCPAGMPDIGVSCTKKSYGRGVGTVPTSCAGGKEYDTGLCYDRCRAGYNGVGPVCWGSCPAGFDDHGATCYREPAIIVKY